jgi:tetratricopeptide (TPR) repeat protein
MSSPLSLLRFPAVAGILVSLPLMVGCGSGESDGDPPAQSETPAEGLNPAPLPDGAEAWSLLGQPLTPPTPSEAAAALQGDSLAAAEARLAADPSDAMARIWVGRRQAYLGGYNNAIVTVTAGMEDHPDDPRFYRHRGHRYVTTRRFEDAEADFVHAVALIEGTEDQIEPDGLPNAAGIPLSTLQFNIWYHLGLAQYLQGDLEGALASYRACMLVSRNPDLLVATSHWLYMTLRELGRDEEAAQVLEGITADMEIVENASYHNLLLMYKGELSPEDLVGDGSATDSSNSAVVYGVGNWYLYNGEVERATEIFEALTAGDQWAAFGSIAAEAKLAAAGG